MAQLLTPEQLRQVARLKFPQPLEAQFWEDWAEKIRKPVRIIAIAGIALCLLYSVATLLVARSLPDWTTNFRSVGAVLPILLLTLWLSHTRIWNWANPVMLWLAISAMAVMNGYGMLQGDQARYERAIIANWMFFSVIVIGSGLALVRSAAIALAILVVSYSYLSYLRPLTQPAMVSNLMILGQTVLFAIAASYVAERRARTEFLLGYLLEEERQKSENLLSNVLPAEIAHRLKDGPSTLAERHEDASVLFADIVDFTPYASSREPDEVVGFLDNVFTCFDELVERRGLEKIKTVGDAYMVAGGVLDRQESHLEAMADLAMDMLEAAREAGFAMRIGIHCGPLVAGVIGRRKFLYDLWGETVNTASRMESHGLSGQIQVTDKVAQRLEGRFRCERRGVVDVKGIGPIETYLLLAPIEEAELASPAV